LISEKGEKIWRCEKFYWRSYQVGVELPIRI
jgi:hypothetical protein